MSFGCSSVTAGCGGFPLVLDNATCSDLGLDQAWLDKRVHSVFVEMGICAGLFQSLVHSRAVTAAAECSRAMQAAPQPGVTSLPGAILVAHSPSLLITGAGHGKGVFQLRMSSLCSLCSLLSAAVHGECCVTKRTDFL